jgi:hypothetical protein
MKMTFPMICCASVAVLAVLIPQTGYSWGDEGHSITALIAQQVLVDQSKKDPQALKALTVVKSILGDTPFDQAATWPDKVKSDSRACAAPPYMKDPEYGKADHKGQSSAICDAYKFTASWHFIDMNNDDYKIDPANQNYFKGDLVVLIKGLVHVLKGEEAPTLKGVRAYDDWKSACLKKTDHSCKKEAVEFLIHLVGDIHQPLHSGASCDIGGNSQYITFFGQVQDPGAHWCQPTDPPSCSNHEIHQLWDTNLIIHGASDSGLALETRLTQKLVKDMAGKIESSDAKKCMSIAPDAAVSADEPNGPLAWVHESACFIPQVYSFPDDSLAKKDVKSTRKIAQASMGVFNRCRSDKEIPAARGHAFSAFAVGQMYYDTNIATINERLYWGGYRLASLLKDIYGNGDKAPNFEQ